MCDKLASETAKLAVDGDYDTDMPPTLEPPYPGSGALLRIGSTWITSRMSKHVLHARWSEPILRYCMDKYGWSRELTDDISWRSIRSARNKCNDTQLMQTTKIMHDWLPVMHMMAHMSKTTQCPSCPHPDETLDHLFHCPHPLLRRTRELILEQLRKKGLKLRIPYPVVSSLCSVLESYFNSTPLPTDFGSLNIQQAITAQLTLGLKFLPRGFLTHRWIDAMEAHGCDDPHPKLASLIYFLWFDMTDSLWRVRNEIVHKAHNLNQLAQEADIDDRIRWYLSNYRGVLSHHDYRLITRLSSTPLEVTPLRTKQQWLYHLETARKAFDNEKLTLAPGQRLLTHYFSVRGKTPNTTV